MNFIALKKYKKLYHNHSAHIDGFPFERMPHNVKREFFQDELELIAQLPFIRLDDCRVLLVNESKEESGVMIELLSGLDNLQDALLNDIYDMYRENYKKVTLENFQVEDMNETYRRMIALILPEILWCHGNDAIKSRLL